ncbi:hypothetical protein PSA3335_08385 [Pseudomonas savastanoi pv. savastanoi NCPPB 3335]|uniref:Uncharacterized protein n=1 Tax=Pseudomonas savastanoi pv. savastanoi NCPPB 3335 TaxID=693985 RepID=A0ABC8BAJ4_PSESS|nr:hypothetical protein PSA3335_08385 [Pseudomonas savastanoi pv. savastanoi NCPPB 3335]
MLEFIVNYTWTVLTATEHFVSPALQAKFLYSFVINQEKFICTSDYSNIDFGNIFEAIYSGQSLNLIQ